MEPEIVQKENVKHLSEVPERASRQASPGKILEAYWQQGLDRIPTAEKEEAVEQIVQAPKAAESADAECAETPVELPYDERVQMEGKLICSLIREQFAHCKTSEELNDYLQQIRGKYNLKQAELVDLGTPDFHVRFQVNPWFKVLQPSGETIYYMEGRAPTPITKVWWQPGTLQLGTTSMPVGRHMIANPLGPDAEAGSDTKTDTEQGVLSNILANKGSKRPDNYIKGHLLNDNVGGPGLAFNLYPITSDANHKHLVAFEKFIKAELNKHYVLYYEVQVQGETVTPATAPGKYIVNSKFHCIWHLLNATGVQLGAKHEADVVSTFGTEESYPVDVGTEYAGLFKTLNHSKDTPEANVASGAREEKGWSVKLPAALAPVSGPLPSGKTVSNPFVPASTQVPTTPTVVASTQIPTAPTGPSTDPLPVLWDEDKEPILCSIHIPETPTDQPTYLLPTLQAESKKMELDEELQIEGDESDSLNFYDLESQITAEEAIIEVPVSDLRLSWIEDLINVPLDGSAPLPLLEVGFWFDDHADYGLLSKAEPHGDIVRLHLVPPPPPPSMEIEEVDQPYIFPDDFNFDEDDFLT